MIIRLVSNFKFLVFLWVALFVATALSSGLELRNLVAAFFAWSGGIVTARITFEYKIRKFRKDFQKQFKENWAKGNHDVRVL